MVTVDNKCATQKDRCKNKAAEKIISSEDNNHQLHLLI